MHYYDSLVFADHFGMLWVYVVCVTVPKRPVLDQSLVQSLVKSTFPSRYAENEDLADKFFFSNLDDK